MTEASSAHIHTGESITPLSVSRLVIASLGTGISPSFLSKITLNKHFENSKQVRDYMGSGILHTSKTVEADSHSLRKYQPMNT